MTDRCPRDGKKLAFNGEVLECRHCGYTEPPSGGKTLAREVVRERIRRVREGPPLSGSCLGWFHRRCKVSTCPCWCHKREGS